MLLYQEKYVILYQNCKHIKKIKQIIIGIVWAIMGLYVLLMILTHVAPVQQFLGSQAANALSQKLGTTVAVGRLDIGFLNRVSLDDVVIMDQQNKQLLRASRLSAKIDILPLLQGRLSIATAQLFGAHIQLYADSLGATPNYQFALDSLSSRDTLDQSPIDLRINSLIMRHSSVKYDLLNKPQTKGLLNPSHLNLTDISAHLILKTLRDDSLNLTVKKLAFNEQSGLNVRHLSLHAEASTTDATISDLVLRLPHSELTLGDLSAHYQINQGRLANNSLHYRGSIQESTITTNDIACLLPQCEQITDQLLLSSSFSGTMNSIDVHQLRLVSADGNIALNSTGFVHHWNQQPAWQVNLDQLMLSSSLINNLQTILTDKVSLPDIVTRLGTINLQGEAEGTGRVFNLNAQLKADAGSLSVDMGMHDSERFDGHVQSDGINLNTLLNDDQFGTASIDLDVSGRLHESRTPSVSAKGTIPVFDFKGYQYHHIAIDANYTDDNIDGIITIDDPNIRLSAEGSANIHYGQLNSCQLKASLSDFRPSILNLTHQWENTTIHADIESDISATNICDATGTVHISNFSMQSDNQTYRLQSLDINSGYDETNQHFLALKSDFGTMNIKGMFDYATIAQSIANIAGQYMPTLPGLPAQHPTKNNFAFQLNMFKSDWLSALFNVPLNLREPLLLNGFINDSQQTVTIMGSCPDFYYQDGRYTRAALYIGTVNDTLRCSVDAVKHMDDGIPLTLSVRGGAADNQLKTTLHWDNKSINRMSGTLNTSSHFFPTADGQNSAVISVQPSSIVVHNSEWHVSPAEIIYSKDNLSVNNFSVRHGEQHISINGKASRATTDSITVDLKDVDVEYVLDLVNFHSVEFSGLASGRAYVSSLFDNPKADARLTVKDFQFEKGRMGILDATARWDNEKKIINIDAVTNDGPGSMTLINGYVDPSSPGYIDLDMKAIGTHIDFARSFTSSFADRVEGQGQGAVRLFGPLNNINLTGLLVLDGEIDVRQLNTTYTLRQDTLYLLPDDIQIRQCPIYDHQGHQATVNGHLRHQHLTNMTFDLTVDAENLLAYDFHDFGNDTFYGTIYGTGRVFIEGKPGRITFDIDVTPNPNSTFVYNVSTPDAITNQEFISWASSHKDEDTHPKPDEDNTHTSDLYLNFTIRCTPDATIRLLMDAKTNDYITLNGNGTLHASYYNKGSLQLFGTYVVNHGTYDMTIQELIKKSFTFQNGGTIVFGGQPFDAQLNLQALHTVNGVSLSDLNVGRSFSNNTVRVNCLMNIGGVAHAPQVDFDLTMPTVSADEQQMVRSVINGQQEMNQQVLYLLGIGRFYPQTGNNSTAEGQTQQSQTSLAMQSLLSGTISSQLNTLLKNVVNNNNWNFGANISTGDEGWNNAEYEGLISGRLLNNRLLLNGQFGYRDRATTANTSFIGDFDVQYLLTPSGSIAIKMYNQTNDRYFTRSSLNTQGLGFILKKDFSSIPDLFGIHRKDSTNQAGGNE